MLAVSGDTAVVKTSASVAPSGSYDDLVSLFHDWRTFPETAVEKRRSGLHRRRDGAQHKALADYQRRLAAIDPGAWPIPQQVDYHLVHAEINGLDFDLRIKRPWARSPSFYVIVYSTRSDQSLREGAHVEGSIELFMFQPPTGDTVASLDAQLRSIPALMEQAKVNLTDNCHDLWVLGIRDVKEQSHNLDEFANESDGRFRRSARENRDRRVHHLARI